MAYPVGLIHHRDAADLEIVAESDAHLHAHGYAVITAVEFGHVRMEEDVRVLRYGACRLSTDGP